MKNLGGPHAFFFCVRQDYEELEKQLKQVFKERSTILRQLTKTSRELDGIKTNLQVRWKLIFSAAKYRESPSLSQWIDAWRLPQFFFFLPVLNIVLGLNMGVIIYYYMSFEKKCHLKCSLRIWGLQIQEWEICVLGKAISFSQLLRSTWPLGFLYYKIMKSNYGQDLNEYINDL